MLVFPFPGCQEALHAPATAERLCSSTTGSECKGATRLEGLEQFFKRITLFLDKMRQSGKWHKGNV